MIGDIEALSGRPLGVYFAQRTMKSSIDQADVDRLYEIIQDLDRAPFDLLVETRGGETDAAEAMISLLLDAKHPFRAIVPNRAKSNGTLICLAAESLVMGATSELGPIEPIVMDELPASAVLQGGDGEAVQDKDDEINIARFHARHALAQTKSVAHRALRHKMLSAQEADAKSESIIEGLCGRTVFPSHGSVIDAKQATELGLKVEHVDKDDPVWRRIWMLYCMLRHDSNLRNIQKIFETTNVSLSILNGIAE